MNRRLLRLTLLATATWGWGCVYYNGLWNAHRYASDARRQERAGTPEAAVTSWLLASAEAESVATHHPHSRWYPEALVTMTEGLGRSGDCEGAAPYFERADSVITDPGLIERLELTRALCALRGGTYGAAEALARPVLRSKDTERRREAAWLAGRAARLGGDPAEAALILAESPERAAGVEQVLALIQAGMSARAETVSTTLVTRKPLESEWDSIFVTFARAIGPDSTSSIVGVLVPRARVTSGARARMYLDDADRLLAAGHPSAADRRFLGALAVAPDSVEADRARVGRVRVRVAQLTGVESLPAVSAELARLVAEGHASPDGRRLQRLLGQVADSDTSTVASFRRGELAGDSLEAPSLAAAILLGFARREPQSLFAPKAILATMPFVPEGRDSLARVLEAKYAASPYTLALRGAPSPGYVGAEDSLSRLFGVRVTPLVAGARLIAQWPMPRTGPRGPLLDLPDSALTRPLAPHRPVVTPGRPGVRDTIN